MAAAEGRVVTARVGTVRLSVPGRPVAKGRPRLTRNGRTYTPPKTTAYERLVEAEWTIAGRPVLHAGPFALDATFVFDRPKSHRLARGALRANAPPLPREDLDNLVKLVCDALNGLAFQDDRWCAQLTAAKRWTTPDERAGAHLLFASLTLDLM